MCRICRNYYEGLCFYQGKYEIDIYCNKLIDIPNIPILHNLRHFMIYFSTNIKEIPNLKGLEGLRVYNCMTLNKISNIDSLTELRIEYCNNIKEIPYIQGLQHLVIKDCKYFYNIFTSSVYKINKFYKINKIKNWYKKIKFLRSKRYTKLWEIAEYYTKKKYLPKNILKYINLD